MSEKLTREQIEKIKKNWHQYIWSDVPNLKELAEQQFALCDLALSAADAEQRGRAQGLAEAVKVADDYRQSAASRAESLSDKLAKAAALYKMDAAQSITESIHALSTSPADHVLVPREASPDDLRERGLMVAVHNDYRLNGEAHTFWLMTRKDGMSFKGEGKTDAEALNQIRAMIAEVK